MDMDKLYVTIRSHVISNCNGVVTIAYTVGNSERIAFIAAFKEAPPFKF